MSDKKIACCVVRDLLPSYIEGLTEQETNALVEEHIRECSDCGEMERNMRQSIPVEKPQKGKLKFLRRIKLARLVAALLTALLALSIMCWLYDREFHYPNTEGGHLAAVVDYVVLPEDSTMHHGVKPGTQLNVSAWEAMGDRLFIFYMAENTENVHGVVHLRRGINGKYRILAADMGPSEYSGGIYGGNLQPKGTDRELFYFAGYRCRDIYMAELDFVVHVYDDSEKTYTASASVELSGEDFLELVDLELLKEELGVREENCRLNLKNVKMYDKDGNEITQQYQGGDPSVSWSSGKSTAEAFMLYVFMGIVGLLAAVFIRYFFRRD